MNGPRMANEALRRANVELENLQTKLEDASRVEKANAELLARLDDDAANGEKDNAALLAQCKKLEVEHDQDRKQRRITEKAREEIEKTGQVIIAKLQGTIAKLGAELSDSRKRYGDMAEASSRDIGVQKSTSIKLEAEIAEVKTRHHDITAIRDATVSKLEADLLVISRRHTHLQNSVTIKKTREAQDSQARCARLEVISAARRRFMVQRDILNLPTKLHPDVNEGWMEWSGLPDKDEDARLGDDLGPSNYAWVKVMLPLLKEAEGIAETWREVSDFRSIHPVSTI